MDFTSAFALARYGGQVAQPALKNGALRSYADRLLLRQRWIGQQGDEQ